MRIGRRVAKILIWGLVLCLSILGGGLWFAYWYMTDSDTAAQLIREHAVRYFPRSISTRAECGSAVCRRAGAPQAQVVSADRRVSFETLTNSLAEHPDQHAEAGRGTIGGARGGRQSSRRCDCAAATTAPGTFKVCSPTPGPVPGSIRRRS